MERKSFIYIAGPYRGVPGVNGDHMSNCHDAMAVWRYFWGQRIAAICPHWSFAQQLLTPLEDVDWLAYTMAQMTLCDAVYRMGGGSSGSDAEVKAARQLGIPVFYDLKEAVTYMQRGRDGQAVCKAEGMDCGDCSGFCRFGQSEAQTEAEEAQSQISTASCHNTGACVWRLTDCSSRGSSLNIDGSVPGPAE